MIHIDPQKYSHKQTVYHSRIVYFFPVHKKCEYNVVIDIPKTLFIKDGNQQSAKYLIAMQVRLKAPLSY